MHSLFRPCTDYSVCDLLVDGHQPIESIQINGLTRPTSKHEKPDDFLDLPIM